MTAGDGQRAGSADADPVSADSLSADSLSADSLSADRISADPKQAETSAARAHNPFLHDALGRVFFRTAVPIIAIMAMNGLFTVVDAAFVGRFVGPGALTAVTLMFPFFMLINASATLVSAGMSSVLSRRLGAGDLDAARATFVGAHALALLVACGLITVFAVLGPRLVGAAADNDPELSAMAWTYISIVTFCSPLSFLLTLQSDGLRCEGKLQLMSTIAIASTLLNILFNYLLIAQLGWGVAGSAWGSVFAGTLAAAVVVYLRRDRSFVLHWAALDWRRWRSDWGTHLSLGAPQSLTFLGVALSSAAVIYAVQQWGRSDYNATIGAYGVLTRVMGFAFLPMLGLSMAFSTVLGNNWGARLWQRCNRSIQLGLGAAFVYCVLVQLVLNLGVRPMTRLFVDDPSIIGAAAGILPKWTLGYFMFGPVLIITSYFQAIGDARRAAVLGLARNYVFSIPLLLVLPSLLGESWIWWASPTAEALMACVVSVLLFLRARSTGFRFGLFRPAPQE